MPDIIPVILAGGQGTRLWPVSRKSYPKQFSTAFGDLSMFQQSALRMTDSKQVNFANPIVMAQSDLRFVAAQQLGDIGIIPDQIIIEPTGKNTAAPILAACLYAVRSDPDAVVLVAPSDHHIEDVKALHTAIAAGLDAARRGEIVTFGIKPTGPETGYGYLHLGQETPAGVFTVERFEEKPNAAQAREWVDQGCYWNAGLFMCRASDLVTAFADHAPEYQQPVQQSLDQAQKDLDFLRLCPTTWKRCPENSIDYAVMERCNTVSCVPLNTGWSDLGNWDAVWSHLGPDEKGVVSGENTSAISCENTLLHAHDITGHMVGVGLQNIVAVATSDGILIADKSHTQNIKDIVPLLRAKNVGQADQFPKTHRPWGWYECLSLGERFQVKRIVVTPLAALSLQSHVHRSEHWIVVQGTAEVTIGDRVSLVSEGQSVYVPLGQTHRLRNPGKIPMVLIEVQTGRYLGEDDIIRYQDNYARDVVTKQ